jgi:hypothetical protein
MKQCITNEKWNQLTDEQKDTFLNHRYTFAEFDYSPVTIGQRIVFLGEEYLIDPTSVGDKEAGIYSIVWDRGKELCNILWEACLTKLSTNQ